LLLTLRFDAAALAQQDSSLARLVASASILPQLLAVFVTATIIFGGDVLRSGLQQLTAHTTIARHWWLWVLANLVLFVALVSTTAVVFEGNINPSLATLWVALVLAVGVSWCCALLPPLKWLEIFRQHWMPIMGAAAIGWAALGIAHMGERLWLPLGRWTLWFVASLLRMVSDRVVVDSAEYSIGVADFSVIIAPQCSGYEGVGLALTFVGTYLWWCRRELRWPQAWLLLPLATGLMWLFNGLRIAALILIGSIGYREIALGGFHSQAGWLAFNLVVLGLVVYSRHSRIFSNNVAASAVPVTSDPTGAYLLPLIALLASIMVTGACSSSFDWLYPVRVLVVGAVLGCFIRHYATWNWSWSWSAVGIGSLVFALWMLLESWATPSLQLSPLGAELSKLSSSWAVIWLIFRVIGSVVIAPLAEELAFRGYLMRRLQSADFETVPPTQFSWTALLISSVIFGALPAGRWIAGTLAGLLYGLAVYRRGNFVDAVLAHATTNALIAAYVLATGTWSLWS